jgi:mono/diheme cytochrome c family protein
MTAWGRRVLWLAVAVALRPALAAPAEDYDFMPKGGKALLLEVLGTPPDKAELGKIVRARRTEAEWRAAIAPRGKGLTDKQLATLVAYLAVNMPLPEAAAQEAAKAKDPASSLPPDGRELAWKQCQSCHSLFTSHLTQIRDVQGWRNVFLSPFHRELKASPQEREEFALYSALNMPMKIEDVPQDLRF